MRLSLLLCLLPLFWGSHALTPQLSKTSDLVIPSKQSELENSSAPPSQIVTFPNMVKTTKLSQAKPAEISKIEALLKSEGVNLESLDTRADFQTQKLAVRGLFVAQFTTKPSRNMSTTQVKIPAIGSFQLKLTEGPVFRIVDQDATDGSALIQMPAATLRTWLQLSQNWGQNSSLEIEDPFYYLKDTVSAQKQNGVGEQALFSMGLRPLPVPDKWQNPYGKNLVLNFTTRDVSSFQMIWVRDDENPADPPFGIKEIGSEGGTVELPGVGKLEIPAGALGEKTMVRLSQKESHPKLIAGVFSEYQEDPEEYLYYDYISPIIKIEPMSLSLKKSVKLYLLTTDWNRIGNNEASAARWTYFNDSTPVGTTNLIGYSNIPPNYEEPIELHQFSYVARVINELFSSNSGYEGDYGLTFTPKK